MKLELAKSKFLQETKISEINFEDFEEHRKFHQRIKEYNEKYLQLIHLKTRYLDFKRYEVTFHSSLQAVFQISIFLTTGNLSVPFIFTIISKLRSLTYSGYFKFYFDLPTDESHSSIFEKNKLIKFISFCTLAIAVFYRLVILCLITSNLKWFSIFVFILLAAATVWRDLIYYKFFSRKFAKKVILKAFTNLFVPCTKFKNWCDHLIASIIIELSLVMIAFLSYNFNSVTHPIIKKKCGQFFLFEKTFVPYKIFTFFEFPVPSYKVFCIDETYLLIFLATLMVFAMLSLLLLATLNNINKCTNFKNDDFNELTNYGRLRRKLKFIKHKQNGCLNETSLKDAILSEFENIGRALETAILDNNMVLLNIILSIGISKYDIKEDMMVKAINMGNTKIVLKLIEVCGQIEESGEYKQCWN